MFTSQLAIFSDAQVYAFLFGSFLLVCGIVAVFVFLLQKLFFNDQLGLGKSFLFAALLVAAFVLLFVVIPTRIEDNRWENIQETCAEEAGYGRPGDNNNPDIATAESQDIYGECTKRKDY